MPTDDFFHAHLDQMIDLHHPLAVLANRFPWLQIKVALADSVDDCLGDLTWTPM